MQKEALEQLTHQACRVIESVGDFIRGEIGRVGVEKIEEKALHSLVSYVDRTAEERLVQELGSLLPGSTFLTEEETVESVQGALQWIIDPLDGTTNFLHQLPVFAISVALQDHGQTIIGIVLEINRAELFYAWQGSGAFLNGKPIRVSPTASLQDALLATGFPYYDYDRMDHYLETLSIFMQETRGIRRLGSAAVDLAYVACGRFDAFFEYSLHAWDVAAGAFLVQEAGGHVSDFIGGEDYIYGGEILASNLGIYNDVLAIISESF
ncbi:MAG: inositol monophosphatase [Saprospirales bacterium]|nr:inositol monophosphatase [Saprospirales bacterium]MBK8490098.1 inositol monophosphatase [Saprospirales bacterium]